jgi:hypothetical protein
MSWPPCDSDEARELRDTEPVVLPAIPPKEESIAAIRALWSPGSDEAVTP